MDRRTFLKACAALALMPRLARAATAIYEVTTRVEVPSPRGVTRVWLPLPLEGAAYQRVLETRWEAPGATVKRLPGVFYARWEGEKPVTLELMHRIRTSDYLPSQDDPRPFLEPVEPLAEEVAQEITRGRPDKPRVLYQWMVERTYRNPKVRGCGTGDVRRMLKTGDLGGKCADLNALYTALCRGVDIPARELYGLRLGPSRLGFASLGKSGDVTRAQHCRAEVFAGGWIAADPADVRKVILEEPGRPVPVLYGGWEGNWMAYNWARDLTLPEGPRLSYFMYPEGESGGRSLNRLDPERFRYSIVSTRVPA